MANWNLMFLAKTTRQRVQYLNPLAWELEKNFMKKLIFLARKYFFWECEIRFTCLWKKNQNFALKRFRLPISNFSSIKFQWSAVTAKYIYWIIQDRGEWSLKEIMVFKKLFCIEMTGAALVAIMKKCEQKDK